MKKLSSTTIFFVSIASFLAYLASQLLLLTCRKEIIKPEELTAHENSGRPVIYAFWHGRLFPMSLLRTGKNEICAVVSRHLDGEFLAGSLRLLGFTPLRGSADRAKKNNKTIKNRGGSRVIRESIRAVEEGKSIAITPDGPKGPGFYFKRNFLYVASVTKTPIVLVTYSASSVFRFNSWDRFIIPKPFSKMIMSFSDLKPIGEIENDEALENYGKALEDELNSMTRKLDNELALNIEP